MDLMNAAKTEPVCSGTWTLNLFCAFVESITTYLVALALGGGGGWNQRTQVCIS